MEFVQIFTSVRSKKEAMRISDRLVRSRLAGCAQVLGPVESTFMWNGKVVKEREWICIVKAAAALYEEIEREIISAHSYEVPEIISFRVWKGSDNYLKWLRGVTLKVQSSRTRMR